MRLQTLTTRVLLFIGLLAFEVPDALGSGASLPGQESSHIQLLSIWVNTTLEHEPGVVDEATVRVGSWSRAELQRLVPWAMALVELLPAPGKPRLGTNSHSFLRG